MLPSAEVVRSVAAKMVQHGRPMLVVDPVMVSGPRRGAQPPFNKGSEKAGEAAHLQESDRQSSDCLRLLFLPIQISTSGHSLADGTVANALLRWAHCRVISAFPAFVPLSPADALLLRHLFSHSID